MNWWRRRHDERDAGVAEAQAAAEHAQAEATRSEERRDTVRRLVVGPLHEAAARNNFAEAIRQGLIEGYGGRS